VQFDVAPNSTTVATFMPYILSFLRETALEWARGMRRGLIYWLRHIVLKPGLRRQIRALRNTHTDRSAFVFANGPSLSKLDPDKVVRLQREQGFHVFAINGYLASDFGQRVRPDYYVLSDPNYWTRTIPPHQLEHLSQADREHAMRQETETTDAVWCRLRQEGIPLFVPAHLHEQTDHMPKLPFCDAAHRLLTNVRDITQPLGVSALTVYKALAIACYMGYRRVYIAGIDNSQFKTFGVDQDNNVYYEIRHYYDDGRQRFVRYRTSSTMGTFLYHFSLYFTSLEKFRDLPIVNLDPDGLVDSFTKRHELDVYRNDYTTDLRAKNDEPTLGTQPA
jgi:hypothetical protein